MSSQSTAGQKTFVAMYATSQKKELVETTNYPVRMYAITMRSASNYLCLAVAATSHSGYKTISDFFF